MDKEILPNAVGVKPTAYEIYIYHLMRDRDISLKHALLMDLDMNRVDRRSVYDVADYFEAQMKELPRVLYYMNILTGDEADIALRKSIEKMNSKKSHS